MVYIKFIKFINLIMGQQNNLFDFSFKVESTFSRYQISLSHISLSLHSFALEQNKMQCYQIEF